MTTTSVTNKRKLVDSSCSSSDSSNSAECDGVDVNRKKLKQEEQKQVELVAATTTTQTPSPPQSVGKRLNYEFFDQDCVDLSKALLGKIIVRRVVDDVNKNSSRLLRARIVETEAYCGIDDPAAHSYGNKRTDRTTAMFMKPGTCYVYNIYGIYCCVNISSKGDGAAVLLRALEPLDGIDIMKKYRKFSGKSKQFKEKDLTSGPSKLCQSLNITKSLFNQVDLCASDDLWLENASSDESNVVVAASVSASISTSTSTISSCSSSSSSFEIVASKRINIDYAGVDACNKLYRFYIKNNKFVSVIDK